MTTPPALSPGRVTRTLNLAAQHCFNGRRVRREPHQPRWTFRAGDTGVTAVLDGATLTVDAVYRLPGFFRGTDSVDSFHRTAEILMTNWCRFPVWFDKKQHTLTVRGGLTAPDGIEAGLLERWTRWMFINIRRFTQLLDTVLGDGQGPRRQPDEVLAWPIPMLDELAEAVDAAGLTPDVRPEIGIVAVTGEHGVLGGLQPDRDNGQLVYFCSEQLGEVSDADLLDWRTLCARFNSHSPGTAFAHIDTGTVGETILLVEQDYTPVWTDGDRERLVRFIREAAGLRQQLADMV